MSRLAMGIDLDLCVGCKACVSSCKQQWSSGSGAARDWVHSYEEGTREKGLALTFYPGLCMQCEDHPCTLDCPTGATYVDPRTGVVMVDAGVCIGCGSCVSNCPYGARKTDPEKGIVEKCNLCAPLVARGHQPACVETCPADCRIFGDLDDPAGPLARFVEQRGAKPLVTAEVDVRPKAVYAGDAHRERILAAGAVKRPERSWLTRAWGYSLPFARGVVPAVGLAAVAGGALVNLKARRDRVKRDEAEDSASRCATGTPGTTPLHIATPAEVSTPPLAVTPAQLPVVEKAWLFRHRAAVRALHWFNALSWVVLLATGTALMSASAFALFGVGFPRWMAGLVGGVERLLRLHVLWGLAWAILIVPLFLLYKHGPLAVLREIRVTRDDLAWLVAKPLAMAGLRRQPMPPQDKYNAGQKLFAWFVLVATTAIIATGLVMTFHVGPAELVAVAVLVHKLAIALVLVGLSIHLTMAVVIADERPALRSMVTGYVDRHHAAQHSAKWVASGEATEEEHR